MTSTARFARLVFWLPLAFLMAGALLMVTPVLSSTALPNPQMPNPAAGQQSDHDGKVS